jgi:hypothetical protein
MQKDMPRPEWTLSKFFRWVIDFVGAAMGASTIMLLMMIAIVAEDKWGKQSHPFDGVGERVAAMVTSIVPRFHPRD